MGSAQNLSQYQDQLDMLPDSVRSSIIQRINSSNFDLSETGQATSILIEDEENDEEKKASENDLDYLDKYDLLQKNSIDTGLLFQNLWI